MMSLLRSVGTVTASVAAVVAVIQAPAHADVVGQASDYQTPCASHRVRFTYWAWIDSALPTQWYKTKVKVNGTAVQFNIPVGTYANPQVWSGVFNSSGGTFTAVGYQPINGTNSGPDSAVHFESVNASCA